MSMTDVPSYFATATGLNVTTAQLFLSLMIIIGPLFAYLILSHPKSSNGVSLILVFIAECLTVGLGWLPFWILIMTIFIVMLSVAMFGTDAIVGSG